MKRLKSFKLFSQLPSELRELIWQAALPATRIVYLEANPVDPEDELDDRDKMLYEEDLHGNHVENEDMRSIPEKDMRLLVHRTSQDLNGVTKQQSQLFKYGFMSSRRTPNISHVSFHDPATYRGFDDSKRSDTPPSRDFRTLLHVLNYLPHEQQNLCQAQLHMYGFKTSRPCPKIRHVSAPEYYGVQRAVRIDNSGSYGSFPVLMQVCRESRQRAIRSGYVLGFSTQWAPARTWFNFKTDFLYFNYADDEEYFPEFHAPDRQRIKRLLICDSSHEPLEKVYDLVKYFAGLEELAILFQDDDPSCEDEGFLVDCTTVEFLGKPQYYWQSYDLIDYVRANPNGPPFFDHKIKELENYIRGRVEVLTGRGEPGFQVPKFRFVISTNENGKRKLEAFRTRYWGEREEFPAKEDWDRFLREDEDARIVARPPSPFDIEHADDLEVQEEIFVEEYYRWG